MDHNDAGLIDATVAPGLKDLAAREQAVLAWDVAGDVAGDPARARPVWANPAALALWRAQDVAALAARRGKARRMEARQLSRIAQMLKPGMQRIERLRLAVRGRHVVLDCLCWWLPAGETSYLIVEELPKAPGAMSGPPQIPDMEDDAGAVVGPDAAHDAAGSQDHPARQHHPAGRHGTILPFRGNGRDRREDAQEKGARDAGSCQDASSKPPAGADGAACPDLPDEAGLAQDDGPAAPEHALEEALEAHERDAFRAIAEALGARMEEDVAGEAGGKADDGPPPDPATPQEPGPRKDTRFSAGTVVAGDDALSVLDRLHVGLMVFRDAHALFANRSFLGMFGFADMGELTRAGDVAAILPQLPADAGVSDHGAGRDADHGRDAGASALVARDRDGEAFAVMCRMQTIRWGGAAATLLTVTRLHEARPAREREVPDAAARVATALDPAAAVTADGLVVALNDKAQRLFAVSSEAAKGRPLADLFADEGAGPLRQYLAAADAAPAQGGSGEPCELRVRPVPGSAVRGVADEAVTVHMVLEPIEGSDLRAALFRDVSAWKRVQGELMRARRAAEQASARKSDLIASVSHELRTPLNSIIGFSELMLRAQFGPLGHDKYADYAQGIRDSGAHVLGLIDDLLDLAKLEAGKLELNFTSVNVNEVVAQAVRAIQPEAGRARVITRSSLAPRLPAIVADQRSLVQICLNLLSNAIKFTPAGGQTVISTMLSAGEVRLRVRDTGAGMSREEIGRALEPFRQLNTAANANQRGTGLGLPLTKALAEANKARFTIDSAAGKGTLIEVAFPPQRVLAR